MSRVQTESVSVQVIKCVYQIKYNWIKETRHTSSNNISSLLKYILHKLGMPLNAEFLSDYYSNFAELAVAGNPAFCEYIT